MNRKSITAELFLVQRNAILSGKYPHLRDKLHQLNALRMQIARKQHAYSGWEGSEAHQRILAEWNNEKEHVEAELSRQIPEMKIEQNLTNANIALITDSLPQESILLEFLCYGEFDFKAVLAKNEKQYKPNRYCVFVIPSGQPENVALIDLGEADKIDQLITAYKSKLTGKGEQNRDRIVRLIIPDQAKTDMGTNEGLQLYSHLIAPLKAAIGNYRHLIIAPDSQLNLIPFEVIPTPEGGYLN